MAKIMIVEDEAVIRQLIMEELEKWQFETFGTTDFHQVLLDFKTEEPQLILLDINLPVFDGYYWCQKIREISKVPIIFISSRNYQYGYDYGDEYGGGRFYYKTIRTRCVGCQN